MSQVLRITAFVHLLLLTKEREIFQNDKLGWPRWTQCQSFGILMDHKANQRAPSEGLEALTLGGGCFWCLEAVFSDLKGVQSVASGYSGGKPADPSYEQISMGNTGHAEVVEVRFDPRIISVKTLLEVFFVIHDPTTMNRQGADVGTQYRSVIFYHSPEQKIVAEQSIKEVESSGIWSERIVTEVEPLTKFYMAEDYHQEYFKNNSYQPYCQVIISPKLAKLRQHFPDRLKTQP